MSSAQPERPSSRVHRRLASSQPVIDEQHCVLAASDSPPEADPTDPAPEKPPRRQRASSLPKDADDRPQLPPALDILWLPDSPPNASALPPPELFEEALTNLHIALHPQTQHRAAYSSPAGPPIEPALALYCPVEGGEYVLDETVRELARRTGAEVLVIDSVHLAAGEWGHFGKGSVFRTTPFVCALTCLPCSSQCHPAAQKPPSLPSCTTTLSLSPLLSRHRRRGRLRTRLLYSSRGLSNDSPRPSPGRRGSWSSLLSLCPLSFIPHPKSNQSLFR